MPRLSCPFPGDPATAVPIQVDLTPAGVAGLDPAGAVVVYPALPAFDEIAAMPSEEIDATICPQGPLFASAEAASTWVTDHPGVHVFGIRTPTTTCARSLAPF